jgi:GNAT superfamily N-acetyltransferase
MEDVPAISTLIAESVRALSVGFYSSVQAESALRHVFGVDSQLIADGSYYVAEDGATLLGAGGWSARRHLYGGDQTKGDADPLLDPRVDAARIRAFFVSPAAARRGIGRAIFTTCRDAAADAGFRRLELAATMPGVPFYLALGFTRGEEYAITLPDGTSLPLLNMTLSL